MIKNKLNLVESFIALKNVDEARKVIQQFCCDMIAEKFKDRTSSWYSLWDYSISGDTLIIKYGYGTYGNDMVFRDSIIVDMRQLIRDEKIKRII